jgi:glycosyltransferase involved in cell wall biosynthesis
MGFGNCVIVRGTPTNMEVVDSAGLSYDPENPIDGLADRLREVMTNPALAEDYRQRAIERVQSVYAWETITDEYEAFFTRLLDA